MRQGRRVPAADWLQSLDKSEYAKFYAKAVRVDHYFEAGMPTAGTFESVPGSTPRLMEFRITPKGAKAPHLRMLGLLEKSATTVVFHAAAGHKKQKDRLEKRDIEAAEAIVRRWAR